MEPSQLVKTLLKYYKDDNMPTDVKFIEHEDNEMTVQVLLTVYLEILKLDDAETFDAVSFLEWSINALGFRINITDVCDIMSSHKNIVHYASITPEGNMLLNPFHPLRIANLPHVPESYRKLLKDQRNLQSIITLHKYADGNVDIITFECV